MRPTLGRLAEVVAGAFARVRYRERGQALVEYAAIIAIVSLGAVVALGFLSGKINTLFSKTGNSVNAVVVGGAGTSTTGNNNNGGNNNGGNNNGGNNNGGNGNGGNNGGNGNGGNNGNGNG